MIKPILQQNKQNTDSRTPSSNAMPTCRLQQNLKRCSISEFTLVKLWSAAALHWSA